jgi:hypothetical protein
MIPVLMAVTGLLLTLAILDAFVSSPSMGGSGDAELFLFLLTLVRLLPLVAVLVALVRLIIARRGGAELGVHYMVGLGLLSVPAVAMVTLGGTGGWSVAGVAGALAILALGILVRRRGT